MTKTEYSDYLSSPKWQETRRRRIEESEGCCERCELPRWLAEIAYDHDLHVHHRSYRNRGSERSEDLEVLCRRCHEMETFGRSELRAPKKAKCEACDSSHWNYRSAFCGFCEDTFINSKFFNRLLIPDITFPPDFGVKMWATVARDLGRIAHIGEGPDIYEVLKELVSAYAGYQNYDNIAALGKAHPGELVDDFEAAYSLIDLGPKAKWGEDE